MCAICDEQRVTTMERADECVAAGIEWLLQNAPADWRGRVNVARLDVSSELLCVLGQVFHEEARGSDEFYESGYDYAVHTLLGAHFDDYVTGPLGFSNYDKLSCDDMTDAWNRALND